MSINSALLAGVSGLVANSSALAAISDNIANVNTTAYKRNQVSFSNLVTSQAVSGRYSAGGVTGVTKQIVSQQGLIQSATSSTDLAISGDGFFVGATKGSGLTPADPRAFTRAGAFGVDSSGFLVNEAGLYLQGWPVQANGTFDINPSDVNSLTSINVKNLGAAVASTSNVALSANVDQTQAISAGEATYVATTVTSMADYAANPANGTKPDFTMEMNVIDSMGGPHKMAVAFLKSSAAPNTWHAEIYAIPDTDVTVAGQPGQVAQGLVKFNQDGSIDLTNSTLFGVAGAAAQIPLAASGAATAPRWANGLGIAAQTVSLDLTKITQYAAASTVNSVSSDGASVGNVVGVQVSKDGVVSALFDNSQIRTIAKIAIATFPNANGLKATSGSAYQATLPAGQLVLKQAGDGGAGTISPSSLESSTVDLSSEFTGLISTQKAYSASSKIITTADTMLDELINIIR
ncbi:MAG TPA: flagellar hook protein FlgE [Phenylobacterium sp.]|nr:flagellar hook protein FlgE [Phenylobacterium sp.]